MLPVTQNTVFLLTCCWPCNEKTICQLYKEQYTYFLLVMGLTKMNLFNTIAELTLLLKKWDTVWTANMEPHSPSIGCGTG